MSYINIPANLQDMFNGLSDRITRLELGYNGPQASADAAQSLALSSQSVATNAQLQAANAAVQAVQAQSQATIASTQATYAVQSANGKTTTSYGTSSPSASGTTVGDLYFQFNGSNQVVAQYTWNGSSWVSNPLTKTVIATLDAGSIVSGTITGIEFNNGSGTFHVTPAGALTASSANITGTIVATAGYIGNTSGGSYWSITSTGITGFGSASITGGLISGSSINIGSGTFQVNSSGYVTATSGNIGGWNIGSSSIYTGSISSPNQYLNASGGALLTGTVTIGALGVNTTSTFGSTVTIGGNLYENGNFYYGTGYSSHSSSGSGGDLPLYTNSSGYIYFKSSSRRFKQDIQPQDVPLADIIKLNPTTYVSNEDYEANGNSAQGLTRVTGLIAEEVAEIDTLKNLIVGYDKDGTPYSVAYDALAVALIPSIKELNTRLTQIEGKVNGISG